MSETARVFVGTDRSQWLGVKVLEYSIHKHSSIPVEVHPMSDLGLPEPSDLRQSQRTGFSFARFAIPELAGFKGKAVYLDADMLVFKDFATLWNIPFDGAKVVIQTDIPDARVQKSKKGAPDKRIKQCAVMLLDCERLSWDPRAIIAGLGVQYGYEDLVYQLCILEADDIAYRIPFEWNSLEHFDQDTHLIHYTDMYTQPWVAPENQHGYLWISYLCDMTQQGLISPEEVQREIDMGFVRPSLLTEMRETGGKRPLAQSEIDRYLKIDKAASFVRHQDVYAAKARRKAAIKEYQQRLDAEAAGQSGPRQKLGALGRMLSQLFR